MTTYRVLFTDGATEEVEIDDTPDVHLAEWRAYRASSRRAALFTATQATCTGMRWNVHFGKACPDHPAA